MMLDRAIAAAERTEAARSLIAQAQTEAVDLVTLSALELCVLDGPRQPLFEERVAYAWTQLGERRRRKLMEEVSAGLAGRGLLIDDSPQPGTREVYRYVLVTPASAAEILARWTITPPTESGEAISTRYVVSAYRPDRENPAGYHLEALQAIMLELLAEAAR